MARHTAETLMLIRRRLGLDQEKFGALIGVARAYVSRLENGHFAISAAVSTRLEQIAHEHNICVTPSRSESPMIAEESGLYGRPTRQPTRAEIEAHIRAWLDTAERIPGGLGYAWVICKKYLCADDIEHLKEE